MKALECSLGSPLGRESQLPPPKPLVIVISGPSGVGKDVVIKVRCSDGSFCHVNLVLCICVALALFTPSCA